MSDLISIYTDAGTVISNPSPIGCTWAWIIIVNDQVLSKDSGYLVRKGRSTESNQAEFYAAMLGLQAVSAIASGNDTIVLYCDSQVTIFRIFCGWSMTGIPVEWREDVACLMLGLYGRISYVLLDGHPNRRQLAAGAGKRGKPVSKWNVECDKMCNVQKDAAQEHVKEMMQCRRT